MLLTCWWLETQQLPVLRSLHLLLRLSRSVYRWLGLPLSSQGQSKCIGYLVRS